MPHLPLHRIPGPGDGSDPLRLAIEQWRSDLENRQLRAAAAKPLAEKFEIQMPVVVLARMKDGQIEDWKRLDEVWALVGDKPAFTNMCEGEIERDAFARQEAGGRDSPDTGGRPIPTPDADELLRRNAGHSDSVVELCFQPLSGGDRVMRRVVTAIAALGVVPSSGVVSQCFSQRFGEADASAKAEVRQTEPPSRRSRRGDVLPPHPALSDLPADGKLLGGGRREGLRQADQRGQGRVPLHRLPGREERGA